MAGVTALAALLAGCGSAPDEPFGGGEAAERIECRVGEATDFERACAVERTNGPDGLALTIRHPDGGFRRLLVAQDGGGVVAADGADAATVSLEGTDRILVAIGGDAYRLPATVQPAGAN